MKADLSRLTFDPAKRRSGVVMQQGRVQLDADWNEEHAIQRYRVETEAADVIGPAGVPKTQAGGSGNGFKIGVTKDGKDLTIGNGRIYVDGILCEATPTETAAVSVDAANNRITVASVRVDGHDFDVGQLVEVLSDQTVTTCLITNVEKPDDDDDSVLSHLTLDTTFPADDGPVRVRRVFTAATQPDYFKPLALNAGEAGRYRVYLDVWERHLTANEDPSMREIALGGPDTATRLQTIWQVKLERIGELGIGACEIAPSPAKPLLIAQVESLDGGDDGFCVLPPTAGFRGLENQLYRIEVHKSGAAGDGATFVWQRDNGSIVTSFQQTHPSLIVHDLGRDDVLGFFDNHVVEITDDVRELHGLPGDLTKLKIVDRTLRHIELDAGVTVPPEQAIHPRMRRWDGEKEIPSDGSWVDLEFGLQVKFEPGTYQTGDYWLIPARSATSSDPGEIDWPRDDVGNPRWQPPHGITHHLTPLALVDFDGEDF